MLFNFVINQINDKLKLQFQKRLLVKRHSTNNSIFLILQLFVLIFYLVFRQRFKNYIQDFIFEFKFAIEIQRIFVVTHVRQIHNYVLNFYRFRFCFVINYQFNIFRNRKKFCLQRNCRVRT